jgi:predicted 3-demethylubiquinone-9 3-methyltransferase (glyoxalase superfamily)
MSPSNIYPCLWFDHNAQQAVECYQTIFDEVHLLHNTPMVVTFEINGTKFMGLNGGPQFKFTPAVSYFVYCGGSKEKIDSLYKALSQDGKIVFPLDKYDWSPRYAWVEDKYGVNWQLDIEAINNSQKIVPCLLFGNEHAGDVKAAMEHYMKIFDDSSVLMQWPFPKEMNQPEGALLFAQFKLRNFIINAMSSPTPQPYGFSEANSFVVECDTQEEIDHHWNHLLADGGQESMCGWLKDKFGVWWQIIPSELPQLMSNPATAKQVSEVVMKSKKFNLDELRRAAS